MPCYSNTIIRINHVKQDVTTDKKYISIWAIGKYPIGGNNEIEVTLYVPQDSAKQNPESQAIFKKDEYYLVSGNIVPTYFNGKLRPKMSVTTSTHLTIIDRDPVSNKSPLNVSLVGIPEEKPTSSKSTVDSVFKMQMTYYKSKTKHDYTIYIVYQHTNPRLKHLKETIIPRKSTISVLGQMIIEDDKFYVNAEDITYIDTYINRQIQSTSTNSKYITTSQTPPLTASSDIESGPSVKRKRT